MSEEKKERLKEYQKNYCEAKKSQYNSEYLSESLTIRDIVILFLSNLLI